MRRWLTDLRLTILGTRAVVAVVVALFRHRFRTATTPTPPATAAVPSSGPRDQPATVATATLPIVAVTTERVMTTTDGDAFPSRTAIAGRATRLAPAARMRLPRLVAGARSRWFERARSLIPLDRVALATALAIGAVFTGLNMFRYPRYELDEGTYIGSAWSMWVNGSLSYYTYNYDHPPLGWFLIGLWARAIGGFRTFGMSINVGRALMLVVAMLSALAIYAIVRRATGRTSAAFIAAIAFVVSPLGVPFHRQVYLDNVGTLFLLLSLYLLLTSEQRLGWVVLSALAFGLSFWTKEVFVVFLPAVLYLTIVQAHPRQRAFAGALWFAVTGSAISSFMLLALLKDELLPPGVLWSSPDPHVSLIATYVAQASREGGGVLGGRAGFAALASEWVDRDPLLMVGGLAATIAAVALRRHDHFTVSLALLVGSFLLFLGRGGITLDYYVIPLIALFAVGLGLLVGHGINTLAQWAPAGRMSAPVVVVLAALLVAGSARANVPAFRLDQTSAQEDAARWIAANLPSDSLIVMDSYPWVDLRDPEFTDGQTFRAHYYWPALNDDIMRARLTDNRWQTIDYVVTSPSLFNDREARANVELLQEAVTNADVIRTFPAPDAGVQIRRVRKVHRLAATANPILAKTWQTYTERFMIGGRVFDPKANDQTTSEGQAYAMLQAVYMDDPTTFRGLWTWTKTNLQVRGDGLLAWRWGARPDGSDGVLDLNSATDADTDAALALLFASRVWDEPAYQEEALTIIRGIWEQETATIAGRRTVVAGNWARGDQGTGQAVVNPSYLAPYAYRIFGEVDPDASHDWDSLVHSSYDLLARIQNIPELGGEVGLVPDWLVLNVATGEFGDAEQIVLHANEFSYDASRYAWRMALDWLWFRDGRAQAALVDMAFPRKKYIEEERLFAAYHMDGSPAADYEALSLYAGVVPNALIGGDVALAHRIYAERVLAAYVDTPTGAHWGEDPNDYYNQNMAWFAAALIDGALGNLWAGERTVQWGVEETG